MPQPKKAARFGNSASHHNMMMANLTTELIRHGRITTTLAKAKTVQPLAERMVTFGKRGDLHARRQVLKVVRDGDVVRKLFDDVGPAFAERNGGYTRVLKLGPRKGDAAQMALIEFTEGVGVAGEGDLEEEPRRRWGLRRRRSAEDDSGRAAATTAGETDSGAAEEQDAGDAVESAPDESTTPDPTGESLVEADPAEVEARLAAEDESGTVDGVVEDAETDADADEAADEDDADTAK